MKWVEDDQMRIYKEGRATLERLDNEKIALKNEFEDAKNSTAGLKVKFSSLRTKMNCYFRMRWKMRETNSRMPST